MRNMHTARPHVRIKKTWKRPSFIGFIDWPVFTDAQDNRAASWEPRSDQIATKPQHKRSRLNGSRKYLATRGDLLQKTFFARRRIFYILSVLWERGRWRCRGSTSTSSTSSSAATLWGSFQTPGRLSTGEITVSSPKNCELLPQKLWGSRWKSFTPWAKSFLSLLIKKLWVPCCKSALIDDWQWVGNLLLATSCRIQGKFNDPDEGRLVAQVAENSWEVNLSPQSSSLWTIISTIIDNYSQQCLDSFRIT